MVPQIFFISTEHRRKQVLKLTRNSTEWPVRQKGKRKAAPACRACPASDLQRWRPLRNTPPSCCPPGTARKPAFNHTAFRDVFEDFGIFSSLSGSHVHPFFPRSALGACINRNYSFLPSIPPGRNSLLGAGRKLQLVD